MLLITHLAGAAQSQPPPERKVIAPKDVLYEVTTTTAVPTDGHNPSNRCSKDSPHIVIIGTEGVMKTHQGLPGGSGCGGRTFEFPGARTNVGNVGPAIAIELWKYGWDDWHHGPVTVTYKVRGDDGKFHPHTVSRFSREGWMQAWDEDRKGSWVQELLYWEDGFGAERSEMVTRRVRESWKVIDARHSPQDISRDFGETIRVTRENWSQINSEKEYEVELKLELDIHSKVPGLSKRFQSELRNKFRLEERSERGWKNEVLKEVEEDWSEVAPKGTLLLLQYAFNATGTRRVIPIGGDQRAITFPVDVTQIERSTRPIYFKRSMTDGKLRRISIRSSELDGQTETKLGEPISAFHRNKVCELLGQDACRDI